MNTTENTAPRILICHPDAEAGRHIGGHIFAAVPNARLHRVPSLTEAYHVTEHRVPDYLIIADTLADRPEAELLFALAKLLGVDCIRLTERPLDGSSVRHGLPMPIINTDAPVTQLLSLLTHRAPAPRVIPDDATRASTVPVYRDNAVILIGASTGGIDALIRVLRHWTPQAPPTLIVQHTGAEHMESLGRLLDSVTTARVGCATDGEVLVQGHVYLAQGEGRHLCLGKGRGLRAALVAGPPVSGHCPSVDRLFLSAVPHAQDVAAALLTGMGRDGAEGLVHLRTAGAATFGQDRATSVVYGMPRIARESGGVMHELPIDRIGPSLLQATRKRSSAA